MIDIAMIPDRLENSVGKSKHQHRLHNFFAEVMIDAINIFFFKDSAKRAIEARRTLFIVAKGLLNNDALP